MNWREFWNADNAIYVSQRHIDENYKAIAQSVLAHLSPGASLLDFGCGYALSTDAFLAHGHTVFLFDPTPKMRTFIEKRYGGQGHVHIMDTVDAIPENSLDAVLVHSVLQYMTHEEIKNLFRTFQAKLKKGGILIASDLVPPHVSPFIEVFSVLRVALAHGFFFSACISFARTFFSKYREIRRKEGFSTFTESEAFALLSNAGFSAERIPYIGLLPYRLAVKGAKS